VCQVSVQVRVVVAQLRRMAAYYVSTGPTYFSSLVTITAVVMCDRSGSWPWSWSRSWKVKGRSRQITWSTTSMVEHRATRCEAVVHSVVPADCRHMRLH